MSALFDGLSGEYPALSITKNRALWLEGDFSMKVLQPQRLVLECARLRLCVYGKDLSLTELSPDGLGVQGVLTRLEWEELP